MKKKADFHLRIKTLLFHEKRKLVLILTLFLFGLILGSISSATVDTDTAQETQECISRFFSAFMIQGTVKKDAFFLSLSSALQNAFWLWMSGWSLWLLPLGFFQCLSKGFRTGFTAASMFRCYPLKGILLNAIALLPQTILILPALSLYLISQVQFAADRKQFGKCTTPSSVKKRVYLHHAAATALFLLTLLVIAFIDGYIVPTLLQPLCGFFCE